MKSQVSSVLTTNPSEKLFEETYTRVKCDYKDLCAKFRHKKKDFSKQYAHIYSIRLSKMKDTLVKRAKQKWGENIPVKRLAELGEETDEQVMDRKCVIIGTLLKNQELRPNILKQISDELQILPQPKLVRFVSDGDELILEDELQRIRVLGNLDVNSVVTGVVAALLGKQDETGKFSVDEVCFAGPQSPSMLSLDPAKPGRYLVMLSGLDLAHSSDSLLPLRMFTDWVTGWLGDPSEQHKNSKIALVLIAGNLIRGSSESKDGKIVNTNVDSKADLLTSVKMADDLLAELTETVHVELMPGEFDPTNLTLPQQPLHYKMFPKASEFSSLHGGTNPHCFQVENRLVAGSSGQPVRDIGRYSNLTDPLLALKSTLEWGHFAPTAPDTLPCYPYYEEDPFILEEQPHILFSGNHEKFQTDLVKIDYGNGTSQKTRLVCIPSFNKTRTCVVVDLTTLDCEKVCFNVGEFFISEPMDHS
ncbi:DNA polymerase delta subunit 2 [Rhodnius prolixus]|uniref:DNA polymerase delta subunit 2 n=1 Tax=Rhodnius prolixus TaxID=13249 RepID=UPI003D18EFBD